MDIIDTLMQGHGELRASLAALSALLDRPGGAGWDDRVALDQERFAREARMFFAAFKAHEAVEDAYLTRVLRQLGAVPELLGAVAEGHRAVAEMTKLFGAVAACGDGERVYRLRTVLSRLREELEAHLSYEETTLFPKLRATLPAGLLRELGRRAAASPEAVGAWPDRCGP